MCSECHQESEFLVLKGERINRIYFVVDGKLIYSDKNHKNLEISVNSSIGELQGVMDTYDSDPELYIRCVTDVTLFSIKFSQFQKIMKKFGYIWDAYYKMQCE